MNADQEPEFASARTKMLLTGAIFAVPAILLWVAGLFANEGGDGDMGGLFEIMFLLGVACTLAASVSFVADRLKARLHQR